MNRSKEDFEQKLREFFRRHDPEKAILSGEIAARFLAHQDKVFEHLTEIYAKQAGIDVTREAIFGLDLGPNTGAEPY